MGIGSAGHNLAAAPSVVSPRPGNVDAFWLSADQSLGHAYLVNGAWSVESLGDGPLGSSPSAITWKQGSIDVFWRGTDNTVWHTSYPPPPPRTFADGTYRVGRDIPAGTYRTRQAAQGCYWERLSGFGGTGGEIIANSFSTGNQVVTIAPTDAGFHAAGCGIWTSDLSATGAWPAHDGVFIVGTDLAAGTYSAPGGSSCYWVRLSGFGGTGGEIIANGLGSAPVVVTVSASDRGFQTSSCGTWSPG
jgi:hypothetical protein